MYLFAETESESLSLVFRNKLRIGFTSKDTASKASKQTELGGRGEQETSNGFKTTESALAKKRRGMQGKYQKNEF
jgi:hypothetical protein